MAELILGAIFIGILLFLYFIGIPVAFAMGASVLLIMVLPVGMNLDLNLMLTRTVYGLDSFTLLAIPFYLFLGRIMNRIGLTEDLFNAAEVIFGHLKGGIAYVNIVASLIFSGMSGAAVADAAGLGRVEYTAMQDRGYSREVSIGVTGASTIIGPIIPPSIPIILYAVLAQVSVGQMFLAGIFPGLLMGIILMAFTYVYLRVKGGAPPSMTEVNHESEGDSPWLSLLRGSPGLVIPVFIIGGIISGYFTATEAGAIAVLYACIIGFVIYDLTPGGLYVEFRDSMVETFSLTFIIGIATIYGLTAIHMGLPELLIDGITTVTSNQLGVLLVMVLILLIIGMFMSATATIVILTPLLIPLITEVGINPMHFGIVMILTLMIGLLTPPFGMVLFVLEKVTGEDIETVIKSIAIFYIPVLLTLLLVIFIPELSLYIPIDLV